MGGNRLQNDNMVVVGVWQEMGNKKLATGNWQQNNKADCNVDNGIAIDN